ncbi:MAG: SWIM zinc finger family protein [Deltaproteobacteria bacterium]|nr:SWIM zinc finger family protein [Deltaproteobacteria bacterium]
MTRMALQRPANDMGDARAVVEAAALALLGARTLERGRRYVAWGAVYDGRRRGAVLRARCEGSGQEAWRVRVTLDPTGVRDAACDCPMGETGDCKHVAAVLLTYAREPEAFVEVPTVDEALEGVDASGLRALLGRLLLQRPELEALVEEALPASFARPSEGARGGRRLYSAVYGQGPTSTRWPRGWSRCAPRRGRCARSSAWRWPSWGGGGGWAATAGRCWPWRGAAWSRWRRGCARRMPRRGRGGCAGWWGSTATTSSTAARAWSRRWGARRWRRRWRSRRRASGGRWRGGCEGRWRAATSGRATRGARCWSSWRRASRTTRRGGWSWRGRTTGPQRGAGGCWRWGGWRRPGRPSRRWPTWSC